MENDMKRDDLIRRSDALNCSHIVYIEYLETDDGGFIEGDADCIPVVKKRDIESIPAVDAVEGVVRCRDCVHYYDVLRQGTQFESGSCDRWFDGTAFSPDDYCSRGQRREDGDAP